MALTANQLNAHLRAMLQAELARPRTQDDTGALYFMLRACIAHVRLGDADSIEAGKTVAEFTAEQILGHAPNAQELHLLRNHWAASADETGGGVL